MIEFDPDFAPVGIPAEESQPHEDWGDATKGWERTRRHNTASGYSRYRAAVSDACKAFPREAHRCWAERFDAGAEVLPRRPISKSGVPVEHIVYKERGLWFGRK